MENGPLLTIYRLTWFSINFCTASLRHLYCRMVVKSGGNWKRPVNRMYTYNFQVLTVVPLGQEQSVKHEIVDWRELLSPHDQLPGDQDRGLLWRARPPLFLRENLTSPTKRHQVIWSESNFHPSVIYISMCFFFKCHSYFLYFLLTTPIRLSLFL